MLQVAPLSIPRWLSETQSQRLVVAGKDLRGSISDVSICVSLHRKPSEINDSFPAFPRLGTEQCNITTEHYFIGAQQSEVAQDGEQGVSVAVDVGNDGDFHSGTSVPQNGWAR